MYHSEGDAQAALYLPTLGNVDILVHYMELPDELVSVNEIEKEPIISFLMNMVSLGPKLSMYLLSG